MDDHEFEQPKVILLSGYARAGKDTFARGLMQGATTSTRRLAFGDQLKEAADEFMFRLGLVDNSFMEEAFKVEHRDILVTLGRFARSLDKEVFANALCDKAVETDTFHIVVTDCRYANEVKVVNANLGKLCGYSIVHIRIETEGVGPANEEERQSFEEMDRETPPDYIITFRENAGEAIVDSGAKWAKVLKL
jgi:hypothetical protein